MGAKPPQDYYQLNHTSSRLPVCEIFRIIMAYRAYRTYRAYRAYREMSGLSGNEWDIDL